MEEKILKMLEHQTYSFEAMREKLKITKEEMEYWIYQLQQRNLLYLNTQNKYSKVSYGQIVANLNSDSTGKKFIETKDTKIFIKPENLHTALKHDLVVVDVYENNLGIVAGIIARKNNRLVCEVISKNGRLALVPFNVGCEVSITVANKYVLNGLVEGDRLVVELKNTVDDTNDILVHEVTKIGHKDDPKSDELAIAISKDFDIDFSKEANIQAMNIPQMVRDDDKIGRTDLTKDEIFTIDSYSTKDIDDAVSIKKLYNGNYLLGVHIADVSYYVKNGTALFNDAKKRGTSLYLGDSVIPMLPHLLSNGICSLNEGVERLAKSCFMEIDATGKVVNYKIVDSVIKSRKKMTYEEINKLFNNEEIDDSYLPFLESLFNMRELSKILNFAKVKRGNIDFASNEVKVVNDEEERPTEFKARANLEAEALIENFMIVTNKTIATHFFWQGLPFIYRVHNMPDEVRLERTIELIKNIGPKLIKLQNAYGQKAIQNILDKYKGTEEYTIISNLLLRNMAKAEYSTKNIGHFALSLDNYCHFTSPIRRFPDLMIHQLLDLFNNDYSVNLKNLEDRLEEISKHSSYKERQADDAERDYLKLKMAQYMQEHIGESFEGIILDIDNDTITIKLDNNIKGIIAYTDEFNESFRIDSYNKELRCVYSKTKLKLGHRVTVNVHEVNVPQKEIYFDLLDIQKEQKLARKK